MSSFYDDQAMCPKCGMTPVMASDTGPFYLYICTNKECPFETKNHEDLVPIDATVGRRESQPSPPTERPDVEGIRAYYQRPDDRTVDLSVVAVCDYALELEKWLKNRLDKEIKAQDRRAEILDLRETLSCRTALLEIVTEERNSLLETKSLLADLVEAGNGLGLTLPEKGSMRGWCGDHQLITPQIDVRIAKKFLAALTAAKEYREKGRDDEKVRS